MHRDYLRWFLALLGLSGILALFFPFADGFGVADGWEWFGRLIFPVVTFPFLISFGYVARLVADKPLRWLNPAGYIAALLISAIALSDSLGSSSNDIFFVAMFTVVPAFCIIMGITGAFDRESNAKGLVALQSTYAVHLSWWLALFFGATYNVGYWLAVLALLVTLAQIALVVAKKWWVIALYAPAAIMWVIFLADV